MQSKAVEWTGEPLFYPRSRGGYGLVIGRYQYIFEKGGTLASAARVTEPVLQAIVKQLNPGSPSAALTFIRKVEEQ